MSTLRTVFARSGHAPNDRMWSALREVSEVMERMANGTASPEIFLSSLDPGIGKTQTVLAFLKHMTASPIHESVGALVCIARLKDIGDLVRECGLDDDQYACLTSTDDLNQRGNRDPQTARVLFTTHARINLCSGYGSRAFDQIETLFFRGKPRAVRIWDETILPGRPMTLSRREIQHVLLPLGYTGHALVTALEDYIDSLRTAEDGTVVTVPDFEAEHGASLQQALGYATDQERGGLRNEDARIVENILFLSGKQATVRRDGGAYGETILDYREDLPAGIEPLLVLDASGRVRETYAEWERGRGGLVRLIDAPKRYDNLKVHVWRTGGGKASWRTRWDELITGVTAKINSKPGERFLVIHHKDRSKDREFVKTVRSLIIDDPDRVSFLRWGRHDATNEFSDVPNVILAGTLFFRPSHYEALGRLASRRPSSTGNYDRRQTAAIELGEHKHLLLQALCRGSVRLCDGDQAKPCNAYVIASVRSGIPGALKEVFPGCVVVPWKPTEGKLTGRAKEAVEWIIRWFDDHPEQGAVLKFKAVQEALGISDRQNFKALRRRDDVTEALADADIMEDHFTTKRHTTGFIRMV